MKNRLWGHRRPRLSAFGAPVIALLFMALAALMLLAPPAARAGDYRACWNKTWPTDFTNTWTFTHDPPGASLSDYIVAKSTVPNTSPMYPSACWGDGVLSWGPGLGFINNSTDVNVGKPSNIQFTEMRIKLYKDDGTSDGALIKTETIPGANFGYWFTAAGSDFSGGPHTAKNWWDQGDSGAG
jgi:hypothetical protein